jgi:glycosyltransferase involved in cell wall biosynthesis
VPDIFIVSRPAAGGIKAHLAGLMMDLPNEGFTVHLHAPKTLLSDLGARDGRVLEISPTLSLSDFFVARRLASLLPRHSLVHAHGIRAGWICALTSLMKPINYLTTLHNVPPTGFLATFALSAIARRSRKLIVVSEKIKIVARQRHAVVIPNGIETDTNISANLETVRTTLGCTPETFLVCCVSRLSHEKGVDILCDAAKHLLDIAFIVAGDGPMRQTLEASAPPNLRFLGHRDDVPRLLSASDCAVFPSRSEGQGIAILEAFVARTPVVASNVGGIPESVIDDETGTLIPPENPQELVKAISAVRERPGHYGSLAVKARAWVESHRRRQDQSRKVAEVYQDILRSLDA